MNLAAFGHRSSRILTQARVIGLADLLELSPEAIPRPRVVGAALTLGVGSPSNQALEGWYEQAQTLAED